VLNRGQCLRVQHGPHGNMLSIILDVLDESALQHIRFGQKRLQSIAVSQTKVNVHHRTEVPRIVYVMQAR